MGYESNRMRNNAKHASTDPKSKMPKKLDAGYQNAFLEKKSKRGGSTKKGEYEYNEM